MLLRPARCLTLLAAMMVGPGIVVRAATPDGPYWIIAGSFSDPDYAEPQYEAIRLAAAAVKRCGLEPFNDFSGKFDGLREGFDVVVVGGFADREAAERALAQLQPCVPEATLRRARYLGE